jgi:hypothetical protein
MADHLANALKRLGTPVSDQYGGRIGRLDSVYIDPYDGAPSWLLLVRGRFGGRYVFVPFPDEVPAQGPLAVQVERERIWEAPMARVYSQLTREQELRLCHHYGWRWRRAELEGRPPGTITARRVAMPVHPHTLSPYAVSARAKRGE